MRKCLFLPLLLLLILSSDLFGQAGISVSPGRVYFHEAPGGDDTQVIQVTNPTNRELEVGISFSDWNYSRDGSNQLADAGSLDISCTDWIQVPSGTYFVLQPKETKQVEVAFDVPEDVNTSIPARTGMLFFTQLNPGQSTDASGAAIQVTVRMGVKIYHAFTDNPRNKLEITGLRNLLNSQNERMVELEVKNTGDIWSKGSVKWEVFNEQTGKKINLNEKIFHTLPGDIRSIRQVLPEDMKSGNYTVSAIVTYGENDVIKIAELDFSL